jgi:hypothetical protein
MNKTIIVFIILFAYSGISFSQNIPASRITDWNSPGSSAIFNFQRSVSLATYGADTSGIIASDNALQKAITALQGSGEVFIPKGTYLFKQTIVLPDSIIIQGEVDASTKASLVRFKLSPGINSHGIRITGQETNTNYNVTYPLVQGNQKLYVSQPTLFTSGDFIKLYTYDDSLLVNDNWALHATGQIFQIMKIEGDSLVLNKPFRRSYSGNRLPVIFKIRPRKQVHIKCIKLERIDTSTTTQTANIYIGFAADCSISGVESNNCNFAHIDIQNSTRITIDKSYFKDGISYGSGGKAYGIMLQYSTGDCYIHQNNFEHLRHSMLLQVGANGNVFAYNYSRSPFWSEGLLPSNSAGDMVLHGNYVYMNLFEGNVVQNIVIDNSHGINGPYNTFYRNRAELYGIFMNNSPASNSQNFIGNQVTNTTSFLLGLYALQGTNHFQYGNIVKGTVMPNSSGEPVTSTLFNYSFSTFYQYLSTIPPIKNSNWQSNTPLIESAYRYSVSSKKSICNDIVYIPTAVNEKSISGKVFDIYPNPFTDEFTIRNKSEKSDYQLNIYNALGRLIQTYPLNDESKTIDTRNLNSGIYFLTVDGDENFVFKLLKN